MNIQIFMDTVSSTQQTMLDIEQLRAGRDPIVFSHTKRTPTDNNSTSRVKKPQSRIPTE